MASAPSGVTPASPQEIHDWLDDDKIVLVDVREPSEYEVEHIAGALLLPLSSFEADLFPPCPAKTWFCIVLSANARKPPARCC